MLIKESHSAHLHILRKKLEDLVRINMETRHRNKTRDCLGVMPSQCGEYKKSHEACLEVVVNKYWEVEKLRDNFKGDFQGSLFSR